MDLCNSLGQLGLQAGVEDVDDRWPRSLFECHNTSGVLDPIRYQQHQRRLDCELSSHDKELDDIIQHEKEEEEHERSRRRKRRRRKCKKIPLCARSNEGELVPLTPFDSTWFAICVNNPNKSSSKFQQRFRQRFRLPCSEHRTLTAESQSNDKFKRWSATAVDACGSRSTPIDLLMLGSLRCLGRGWTFDDLEESTGVDKETHRQFLHAFLDYGSDTLCKRHVSFPTAIPDLVDRNEHEFSMAGFHGALGSMDGTHVVQWCVAHSQQNQHLGFKDKHAARTYNLICNHRRRILCTAAGHPGTCNDKTLARFDELIAAVRRGHAFQDNVFELCDEKPDGTVYKVKCRGVWFLCDNGCLNWGCTVPPFKRSTDCREIRFSEWLESMRKDVECCFGTVKGRWRMLKTGVRLHGAEAGDKVWMTCCALHDWLLEADGLGSKWTEGVPSEWEGSLGEHEQADVPLAAQRLNAPSRIRSCDTTEVHGSADVSVPEDLNRPADDDMTPDDTGAIPVNNLSVETFRSRLVTHFDICFRRKELRWPRRLRNHSPREL